MSKKSEFLDSVYDVILEDYFFSGGRGEIRTLGTVTHTHP